MHMHVRVSLGGLFCSVVNKKDSTSMINGRVKSKWWSYGGCGVKHYCCCYIERLIHSMNSDHLFGPFSLTLHACSCVRAYNAYERVNE